MDDVESSKRFQSELHSHCLNQTTAPDIPLPWATEIHWISLPKICCWQFGSTSGTTKRPEAIRESHWEADFCLAEFDYSLDTPRLCKSSWPCHRGGSWFRVPPYNLANRRDWKRVESRSCFIGTFVLWVFSVHYFSSYFSSFLSDIFWFLFSWKTVFGGVVGDKYYMMAHFILLFKDAT